MGVVTLDRSKVSAFTAPLCILYIFVFFRPLVILSGPRPLIAGLNMLEIFSVATSYLLILSILWNVEKIRVNAVSILIVSYVFYCFLSLLWGSKPREIGRIVLPFITFFAAATALGDKKQLKMLLAFFIAGYFLFIVANFVAIVVFKLGATFEFRREIERFAGVTGGPHTLAHTMFIFSPLYIISHWLNSQKLKPGFITVIMIFLLLASIYCIYKSYTRTVYVGVLAFWFLFFFGTSKRNLLLLVVAVVVFATVFSDKIIPVFYKDLIEPLTTGHNVRMLGSGRVSIWEKSLDVYSGINIEKKLLGIGLGGEISGGPDSPKFTVATTHNDFLGLIVELGPIGFLLYVFIIAAIARDVFFSRIDKRLRYMFLSFLTSVVIMNFLSNSYISRVELAQFFWLFIGLFYAIRDNKITAD